MNEITAQLIAEYAELARARAAAVEAMDEARGRAVVARLLKVKARLRLDADGGRATLIEALEQELENEVKLFISASLLAVDEARALAVLDELARAEKGLIAMSAETTAAQWRSGANREFWS